MKKIFKPLVILGCLGVMASCTKKEQPVIPDEVIDNAEANYTVTPDPTDAFTFDFKNLSKNYKRLEWRFGDDTLSTAVDVKHTYLTAQKFTVDLKAFSSTGVQSRRFYDINIVPDSILKIIPSKTGTPKELKLTLQTKFPLKSAVWIFNDVNPAAKVEGITPVLKTFQDGIQTFSVTATSTRGSVVTVTKSNATTEGYVTDISQYRAGVPVLTPASADNAGSTTENATKLFDGNGLTKMYKGGFKGLLPVTFDVSYSEPQAVKYYAIGNSNDSPDRDPKRWNVEGSVDGVNWTVLDTRTMAKTFKDQRNDLGFKEDNKTVLSPKGQWWSLFYYAIADPKPYKIYRWKVLELWGSNDFQASEFRLYK